MPAKAKRVIIDTNLWISFLIKNDFRSIDNLIIESKVKLILSQELLEEFIQVTQRPKFKKFFKPQEVKLLLNLLDIYGELVPVTSTFDVCRDSKDNFLLSLAVDGRADYLLSGDKDLLQLKRIKSTKIITLTDFLNKMIK